MKKIEPYSRQKINKADLDSALCALKSDNITQGALVEKFEKKLAKYLGVKFVAVFNSATSALNIAYKIANVRNKAVLTTPLTFCATSNMLLENGAEPRFCAINELGNIDFNAIKKNMDSKIGAIVSIDYAGNSVEADRIAEFCKKKNIIYISDSSHSFGGKFRGQKVGGFADMSIFSFHAIKPITTIEGGAIATNSAEFYQRAKLLGSHGIIKGQLWDSGLDFVGYNFRLSDVACALGLSQLKKIDKFINKRHKIALFYDDFFAKNPYVKTLKIPNYIESSHHLYPIFLNETLIAKKAEIFKQCWREKIGVQSHYKPLYQYNLYKNHANIPSADSFFTREISIPCHQNLKNPAKIASKIEKILAKCAK